MILFLTISDGDGSLYRGHIDLHAFHSVHPDFGSHADGVAGGASGCPLHAAQLYLTEGLHIVDIHRDAADGADDGVHIGGRDLGIQEFLCQRPQQRQQNAKKK